MSVPGPVLGPCEAWIDGTDVADCCSVVPGSEGASFFDVMALEASAALFEISGRQFPGLCTRTVRPCQDGCGCWGSPSTGLGPWAWSLASWGGSGSAGGGWWWWNECGDRCGCGVLSRVRLAGYPVREIVEVKIDGVVLDPLDADGNPNYRLDDRRNLIRMDSPGPPVVPRRWPACQNLALDETQQGTFAVTYKWGLEPPELGRRAAAALACQLVLSCPGSGADCVLPSGATRIVRQGVEVDRGILINWFDPTKATGIVPLDMFLRAYWPDRDARRTPAVWSPDVQPFARQVGS